ncbi:MAG: His/Gly/Thr/Pro-type tRNA ligase C-terminal domain-containing protein, partial [Planctomycetota bacterium]
EHFAGAFPMWLAPEQVRVLPISDKSTDYANEVAAQLRAADVRVTVDHSSERIQSKVRAASEMKIPYLAVVGPRDADAGAVSVRARGIRKDLGGMPLGEFIAAVKDEIATRAATLGIGGEED